VPFPTSLASQRRQKDRQEASLAKLREDREQKGMAAGQQIPPVFVHGRWLGPRELQDLRAFILWTVDPTP